MERFRGKHLGVLVALMAVALLFIATPAAAGIVDETVYELNEIAVITENTETPIGLRVPLAVTFYDQYGKLFVPAEAVEVSFSVDDLSPELTKQWALYDAPVAGNLLASNLNPDTGLITIPAGESSGTVYLKPIDAGQFKFSVTDGELTGEVVISATLLPAKRISLETDAVLDWGYVMDAGSRVGVYIYVYDQFGNNPSYDETLSVNLLTNSPEGKFYASSDPGDTTVIDSVELIKQDDGTVSAKVYYSDTLAYTRDYYSEDYQGDSLVTVTHDVLDWDQFYVEVQPLDAVNISLVLDMELIENVFTGVENCFELIYVDEYGNPTEGNGEIQYFAVTSSDNGAFYQNGDRVTMIEVDEYGYGHFEYVPSATGPVTITVSAENAGMTTTLDVTSYEFAGEPFRVLMSGWNTLSFPIVLNDMSLYHILGPDRNNVEAIYGYVEGQFTQITDLSTEIRPLDAVFVKVAEGKVVNIYLDFNDIPTSITAPPTKGLDAGWNFVGTAFIEEPTMPVDIYFASVNDKYSQVVYPGYDYDSYALKMLVDRRYGYPWVHVAGQEYEYEYDKPEVSITLGYWVFMKEEGTLAGFSFTPITYLGGKR